jgi:hypothetical protein
VTASNAPFWAASIGRPFSLARQEIDQADCYSEPNAHVSSAIQIISGKKLALAVSYKTLGHTADTRAYRRTTSPLDTCIKPAAINLRAPQLWWCVLRFADQGEAISPADQQTPEALGRLQKAEIEKWSPIIKAAGIKAG